jgi:hypothetical protein
MEDSGFNGSAWICISKDPESTVRADDGYSETLGESYEWLAKLPNGREIKVGDAVIIRNSSHVVGFSVIESITKEMKTRETSLCPKCHRAQVRVRKTIEPKYLCANCGSTFELPKIESSIQEHRRAFYAAGWESLEPDARTFQAWKRLSKNSKSQFSMQPVDLMKFADFRSDFSSLELAHFNARAIQTHSGHKLRTVRTRLGQSAFRKKLLEEFGSVCAFTGPNHPHGLEAAHLYSYSKEGIHHSDGGLLLRRDIHSFFDRGLLAFDTLKQRLVLSDELLEYGQYRDLAGGEAKIPLPVGVLNWLDSHWMMFRSKP